MAKFYVLQIKLGKMTFEDIPAKLRKDVAALMEGEVHGD